MQNHYNLIYREEEREMFPTLKVENLSSCWLSLNGLVDVRRRLHPVVAHCSWEISEAVRQARRYDTWRVRSVNPLFL